MDNHASSHTSNSVRSDEAGGRVEAIRPRQVSSGVLRERLQMMEQRLRAFVKQAEKNGGQLKRHEAWRKEYLSFPYLIGAPDERIAERFRHVFVNQTELGTSGKLGLLPVDSVHGFMPKFTHLLEEYGVRCGNPPEAVVSEARKPLLRYFDEGEPIAFRMFDGYVPPNLPFVVKYGRREFLEPMLHAGRLRLSPASYYNEDNHNDAVRDDELNRVFFIPTFRERLSGIHHIDFQGHRIDFGDDDISIPIVASDYYLFSLCDHIYYRLPTDFEADAALIIRNPARFSQRLISAFLARWPDWEPHWGPVTYYDPYRDYRKVRVHEMAKHFSYAYQREVRIVLRPKHFLKSKLEPEFLDIGPMTEYADLLFV